MQKKIRTLFILIIKSKFSDSQNYAVRRRLIQFSQFSEVNQTRLSYKDVPRLWSVEDTTEIAMDFLLDTVSILQESEDMCVFYTNVPDASNKPNVKQKWKHHGISCSDQRYSAFIPKIR